MTMNRLDPANMPLEGYTLIEASAGTGKTYTITSLYLRLIMEGRAGVKEILVVTYTRAATEELRLKIRERLQNALWIAEQRQRATDDQFVRELIARLNRLGVGHELIKGRIREALLFLDESAVFTIHSFCQRMLREFAFESSAPLNPELMDSDDEIIREGCAEFVRRHIYGSRRDFIELLSTCYSLSNLPENLYDEVKTVIRLPHPRIVPECSLSQVLSEVTEAEKMAHEISTLAASGIEEIKKDVMALCREACMPFISSLLENGIPEELGKELKKAVSSEVKRLADDDQQILHCMAAGSWFKFEELSFLDIESLCRWSFMDDLVHNCMDPLANKRYKKLKSQIAPYRARIESLLNSWIADRDAPIEGIDKLFHEPLLKTIMVLKRAHGGLTERLHAAVLLEASEFARHYAKRKREQLCAITYDDMLVMLHDALRNKRRGHALAAHIRNRYRAALIDEFQDTDRIQWEIFRNIYRDPEKSSLFLIGDPKQAIYGFRGADIFTYLNAAQNVKAERRLSLDKNWRSHPSLVNLVNRIFQERGREPSFVLPGIEFIPVNAREDYDETLEIEAEDEYIAAEVWHFPDTGQDGNDATLPTPPELAAGEIARLITLGRQEKARFVSHEEERPVGPGDITVLVRDFIEAAEIRKALQHRGIASVYTGTGNVFETHEARETLLLLRAVSAPSDLSAVCTALGSVIIGYDAARIHSLKNDFQAWEETAERFSELRDIWTRAGVMAMMLSLFQQFHVHKNLLALEEGERRLTNMRQIISLLAEAEREHPGMERLIMWLRENINAPSRTSDAQRMRLETDETLVKIMTYHKSKGLEFPIVFLPFIGTLGRKKNRKDIPRYYSMRHDCYVCPVGTSPPQGNGKGADKISDCSALRVDDTIEGETEYWEEELARQQRAEEVRLAYVALTRARNRMYLCFPDEESLASSITGRLLTGMEPGTTDLEPSLSARLSEALSGLENIRVIHAAKKAAGLHEHHLISTFPEETEIKLPPDIRRGEPFSPRVWTQTSFSNLAGAYHLPSMLRHDETSGKTAGAEGASEGTKDIFSFPRGAVAGNCVHRLFELIDFRGCSEEFLPVAHKVLDEFGIDNQWADVLADTAERVLQTELAPELALSMLEPSSMAREMDFVHQFGRREKEMFASLSDWIEKGVIKGFIDLVFEHNGQFYILDYKTNWLGNTPDDYLSPNMDAAMDQHNYWLQAALYSAALNRYLETVMDGYSLESSFGGIFYIFIRGVGHEGHNGAGIRFIPKEEILGRYPALFAGVKHVGRDRN